MDWLMILMVPLLIFFYWHWARFPKRFHDEMMKDRAAHYRRTDLTPPPWPFPRRKGF